MTTWNNHMFWRFIATLGGRLGKIYWRIDSGLLGAYGDMYRSYLVKRNRGPYLIKFRAQRP